MNNETQKVDVLAVLERMSHSSNVLRALNGEQDETKTGEEFAAIDTVADLIKAATEVRAAHRELPPNDFSTAQAVEARQIGEDRIGRAHCALDAALARIGGA